MPRGGAIGARMAGVDVESHFTLRRMNDWHWVSAICHACELIANLLMPVASSKSDDRMPMATQQ
jgi:hypothetical protein